VHTIFGKVSLSKSHILQHKSFAISMYLQSLMCTLAQNSVFEEASDILNKMLSIDMSAKQLQRVSEYYGGELNPIIQANHTDFIPKLPDKKTKDDYLYIMLDGCMLFTLSDAWKENKLARIFYASNNITIQEKRNQIINSIYVSHLGGIDVFLPKLERHLNLNTGKKVFVADGAKWIWKWVEDNYPGAIQILDFFHVLEKLGDLAKLMYKESEKKQEWIEKQKHLLLNDQVYEVIKNIKATRPKNESIIQMKEDVIRYFEENEDRMLYKTYKDKGLLIGSGPIEAAHRNVIQRRMKLSGQKWSIQGANAIANLRCLNKSNSWSIVEKLIKLAG
jgi:hypothetical protein